MQDIPLAFVWRDAKSSRIAVLALQLFTIDNCKPGRTVRTDSFGIDSFSSPNYYAGTDLVIDNTPLTHYGQDLPRNRRTD
jgi:hypothetical protein